MRSRSSTAGNCGGGVLAAAAATISAAAAHANVSAAAAMLLCTLMASSCAACTSCSLALGRSPAMVMPLAKTAALAMYVRLILVGALTAIAACLRCLRCKRIIQQLVDAGGGLPVVKVQPHATHDVEAALADGGVDQDAANLEARDIDVIGPLDSDIKLLLQALQADKGAGVMEGGQGSCR